MHNKHTVIYERERAADADVRSGPHCESLGSSVSAARATSTCPPAENGEGWHYLGELDAATRSILEHYYSLRSQLRQAESAFHDVRIAVAHELLARGLTTKQVGEALEIAASRVAQIAPRGIPRARRRNKGAVK
jgi:hypothetical protein